MEKKKRPPRVTPPNFRLPQEAHLAARVPDEANLGPAMRKLNPRRRLVAILVVDQGVNANFTRAVRLAGYADGPASRVQGHILKHDPEVIAAISELVRQRVQTASVMASAYLVQALQDPKMDPKERRLCATALLDRGGIPAVVQSQIDIGMTVTHRTAFDAAVELYRQALELGVAPAKWLGDDVHAVEAKYRVLDGQLVEREPEPEHYRLGGPSDVSDAQIVQGAPA